MTQIDIAELKDTEVDWQVGRITRKRSKTEGQGQDVPVVCYKLWQPTFELLKRHRSGERVVLLTESGGPWAYEKLVGDKLVSTDNIASNYKWLRLRIEEKERADFKHSPKLIRKTSSTLLGSHEEFGRFAQHFLGHSPRTVADKHYVKPSQGLFDAALDWLGRELRVI